MAKKKTWTEKRDLSKEPHITILGKSFSGVPAGSKLLISSPQEIDAFIKTLPKGKQVSPQEMRKALAEIHKTDATCPVSTGIFLRIVAEAAIEEYRNGAPINSITPFWQVIPSDSATAKKLNIGSDELQTLIEIYENA